jgi:hypothetical protein
MLDSNAFTLVKVFENFEKKNIFFLKYEELNIIFKSRLICNKFIKPLQNRIFTFNSNYFIILNY